MDIGTGIAILGIWVFPSVCAASSEISGNGFMLSIMTAVGMTVMITQF